MSAHGSNGNSTEDGATMNAGTDPEIAHMPGVSARASSASPGENSSAASSQTGVTAHTAYRSSGSSPYRSLKRQRRKEKKRRRERRRVVLASGLVVVELLGFCLANLATRDSWAELIGFLLLQPVQIVLNDLDAHFQFTRGLRDEDAVLLVTMISLPLNLLFWYGVWRGWRQIRRRFRRRKFAPGGTHGAALPVRSSGSTLDSTAVLRK